MSKLKQKLRILTKRKHNKDRFKLTSFEFHLSPKILLSVGFCSNPSMWAHDSKSLELRATHSCSTSGYPLASLLNYTRSQQLNFSLTFSKLLGVNHFHGFRYYFF